MTDIYSKAKRRDIMRRVRSADTKPELRVRSLLHHLGYRFRLHREDLPGRPDVVLARHRTAIFIHGCFWHQHSGCKKAALPKSNRKVWAAKLARNLERDLRNIQELEERNWKVAVVWECDSTDPVAVVDSLVSVLPGIRDRARSLL